MPNQRKKGLKYVSAWIDEALYRDIIEESKRRKIPKSDVYKERLEAARKRYEKKPEK